MKNKKLVLSLVLFLIVALCCVLALTACNDDGETDKKSDYEEGDSIVDEKDMEYVYYDEAAGYGYSYSGKKYEIKYLVKDGSKSYVTLEGEAADKLVVTGYKGAIKKLSLKEIEETVQIKNAPVSIVGIGKEAFRGSVSLDTVDLTKANPSLEFAIEDSAFRGCVSLTSVTLPKQVYTALGNKVGDFAFANCPVLATVSIASSFNDIGRGAFYGCQALTSITLPSSVSVIAEGTFAMCDSLTTFGGADNARSIQANAFQGTALTEFDFTRMKNLVYVGANAFAGTELSQVEIPATVTYVGSGAFQNIPTLASVKIPFLGYSVAETVGWTFNDVYGVTNWLLENEARSIDVTVTATPSIPYGAFEGSTELKSVTIESLLDDGNYNVYASDGTSYNRVGVISSHNIPALAFYNCQSLQSVSLPAGVVTIGNSAFENCYALTNYTLPSTLESIGNSAFKNCFVLDEIMLPASLKIIGAQAFYSCTALSTLNLPSKLVVIGSEAFFGCRSLTEITLPASLQVIGSGILGDCASLAKLSVEKYNWITDGEYYSGEEAYAVAPLAGLFSATSNVANEADYDEENGSLYLANGKYLPKTLKEVSLGRVNALVANAFSGWKHLQKVSITLCDSALRRDNELIPFTVGSSAFYGCENLTSLVIEGSDKLTVVGSYAFYGCYKLEALPQWEALTTVGNYAFYGCRSLTAFVLPATVRSVGVSIIGDCIALTSLTVGSYNFYNDNNAMGSVAVSNLFSIESVYYNELTESGIVANSALYVTDNYYYIPKTLSSVVYNNVVSLAAKTFDGWKSLVSAEINFRNSALPSTSFAIGASAFNGCTKLATITIGNVNNVQSVGSYAFANTAISEIALSNKLTTIAEGTFKGCSNLQSVAILSAVNVIGASAFEDCSVLQTVALPSQLRQVSANAFANCTKLATVYYGGSSIDVWNTYVVVNATGNAKLTSATKLYKNSTNCVHDDKHWRLDEGQISTELTLGEAEVVTPPTCDADGVSKAVCTICNEEVTFSVPAQHTVPDENATIITPASCGVAGKKMGTCSVCGKEATVEIPALQHELSDWQEEIAATCDTDGRQVKLCNLCSQAVEWQVIPAKGHELDETGYCQTCFKHVFHVESGDGTCAVCGESLPYTIQHSSPYPFLNLDGVWTSSNQGVDDSFSTITITATATVTFTFRCKVSSEAAFDQFFVLKNSESILTDDTGNKLDSISGEVDYKTYVVTLEAGDTLVFRYVKDRDNSDNDDTAFISNWVCYQGVIAAN